MRFSARPWLLLCLASSGCVPAGAPYRFSSPLVGGVMAREPSLGVRPPQTTTGRKRPQLSEAPEPLVASTEPASVLPPEKGEDFATYLRSQVGTRNKRQNHSQFVVSTLGMIGLDLPGVDGSSGPNFVEAAMDKGATSASRKPRLGDIVVFNDVVERNAASLLGVVISSDNQGTTEFLYLGRGVVRRGYVNPTHPAQKRDTKGRALNTFVRHSDGKDPIGTRFVAGQLFSTFIATDKLAVPRKVAALRIH